MAGLSEMSDFFTNSEEYDNVISDLINDGDISSLLQDNELFASFHGNGISQDGDGGGGDSDYDRVATPLKCKNCEKQYKDMRKLIDHVNQAHDKKNMPYVPVHSEWLI